MSCEELTKLAQSSGPENIDPERPLSGLLAPVPVLSPSRITLENNGKIRPQPDRENAFVGASGGGDGTGIQRSPLAKSLLQWMQIFDSKGQTESSVVLAQLMNLAVSRVALQQFAQRLRPVRKPSKRSHDLKPHVSVTAGTR